MRTIRLGVIGPGLIWDLTHRDIIRGMSKTFEVTALSARSEETRQKGASQFPEAAVFADYRELIRSEAVDAVVVLTPIPMNAPVAMEVLAAGKQVIMEKPMATSVEEARRLIEAESQSRGNVYILEQFPHKPIIPLLREIMESGELGRVLHFEYVAHACLKEAKDPARRSWGDTPWRQESAFPLGNIFDGGIHNIALGQMLFGPPESLTSSGADVRPGYGEYDTIATILTYPGGLLGLFSHSGYLPEVHNYLIVRGDEGAAEVGNDTITIRRQDGGIDERRIPMEDESALMWREIAECLAAGTRASYSTERSLADLRVLEGIATSLATGARVTL
ncbi:MAG: Gfo/Idh/MocA family protein [Spirochaetaceae bacterium]